MNKDDFYIVNLKIQMKGKVFQKIQMVMFDWRGSRKPGQTNNHRRDWKEPKINLRKAPVSDGFTGEFFQFYYGHFPTFVSTFNTIPLKIPTESWKKIRKTSKKIPYVI